MHYGLQNTTDFWRWRLDVASLSPQKTQMEYWWFSRSCNFFLFTASMPRQWQILSSLLTAAKICFSCSPPCSRGHTQHGQCWPKHKWISVLHYHNCMPLARWQACCVRRSPWWVGCSKEDREHKDRASGSSQGGYHHLWRWRIVSEMSLLWPFCLNIYSCLLWSVVTLKWKRRIMRHNWGTQVLIS